MVFIKFLLLFVFCVNCSLAKDVKIDKKTKIIGVVADYLPNVNNVNNYTTYPIHGLRIQYIDNLSKACASENVTFVMIPSDLKQVDKFVNIIDGLVITGGWDVDPKYYNQKKHEKTGQDSNVRSDFEIAILKKSITKKKPIFTICRGMQIANIALGGDMIQDIPSYVDTKINHSATNNGVGYFDIAHDVKLKEGSLIKNILKKESIGTNSSHHQALGKIGKGLVVSGVSPTDNIVEVIEMPDYDSFFLGVEWHPEFLATKDDENIIKAFCKNVVENN